MNGWDSVQCLSPTEPTKVGNASHASTTRAGRARGRPGVVTDPAHDGPHGPNRAERNSATSMGVDMSETAIAVLTATGGAVSRDTSYVDDRDQVRMGSTVLATVRPAPLRPNGTLDAGAARVMLDELGWFVLVGFGRDGDTWRADVMRRPERGAGRLANLAFEVARREWVAYRRTQEARAAEQDAEAARKALAEATAET